MFKKLQYSLAIFLWVYIILRAIRVPITHDEAYSFFLVKTNYIKAMAGTANTHWLNSIGMKLGSLFSDAPFFLRIFSVLAWPIYAVSAIKISEATSNKIIQLVLFVLLIANPFLIDFFSLARGYGLACAFVLASLWLSVRAIKQNAWSQKDWLPALFCASVAVGSNYTSFYFFISFVAFYVLAIIVQKKIKLLWPPSLNLWWILIIGVSVIAVSNLLFIKLYTGDLEYGGDSNFIMSVFGSLVRGTMYFKTGEGPVIYTAVILPAILLSGIVYAVYVCVKQKAVKPVLLPAMIVLMMSLLSIFFHVFFKTPYLLSRTTLIFYPCICVLLLFCIDEMDRKRIVARYLLQATSLILVALASFHFLRSANLSYCYEWIDQAETQKSYDVVAKDGGKKVLVHLWHSGVFANYYSVVAANKYPFTVQKFRSEDVINLNDSFINVILSSDHMILLPPFNLTQMKERGINFTVLKQFPITQATVLRIDSATQMR